MALDALTTFLAAFPDEVILTSDVLGSLVDQLPEAAWWQLSFWSRRCRRADHMAAPSLSSAEQGIS
jgi:hypothetical protein